MRILIGLDGSPQAAAGVDFVRQLPLASSDELIVVAVAETWTGLSSMADSPEALPWYDQLRESATKECQAIVDKAAASLAGHGQVTPLVVEGYPLDVLQRLATEHAVDLVVVGPHGRGRLQSLLLGSVSQGLLHSLGTSILVARPIRHEFRTVILAVDGSAHSRAAARLLARLPLPAGTTVVCLTVIPSHSGSYGRAWSDELLPIVEAEERAAAERAVDDAEQELRPAPLVVTRDVRAGTPKQAILDAVGEHGSDLVALGARGLGGFEALILGSVSRAVSKAAPCSVLVAHAPPESA